jgi:hypothetical protein
VRLLRRDDIAQLPVRKLAIADEIHLADRRLLFLDDLEHEVDAIVRLLNRLRLDARVEISLAPVDFDDALHVRLNDRARKRAARTRLHFARQHVVLDLVVAFEGDAIDRRILDDRHDDAPAALADLYVLIEAGGVKRLQRLVDLDGVDPLALPDPEIAADGFGLDALVPAHFDLLRLRDLRRDNADSDDQDGRRQRQPQNDRHPPEIPQLIHATSDPP